ncbi:MAG: TonB-dependent receptor, partial [Myxococcota bacterium]
GSAVRWWMLAGLGLWAIPTVAWADPKDDARRHFAAGLAAAQEGNYEIALQRFLAAQEAYPHPATLYNIAKAYTDLDDLPNALTYYRLFRDAAPDKAADVEPVIAVLEARLGQQQAPVAVGPAAPVDGAHLGPTDEELARLDAIAHELGALTEALQHRATEETAATTPAPGEPAGTAPTEGAAEGALAETAFLEEAYERVVVTSSRVGQDPLDSPATVTVLTADDIRLSGVLDVPDLLRRVVGVDVMSPAAGHSDVAIRGFQRKLNNKVLILVDGRSTYLDFLGITFWGSIPIELEEIERIEVIRGPGSAVYGANAVTGVINIITRTPGEGPQVVTGTVGNLGIGRAAAVATGRDGATSYRISAGIQQHGRWSKEVDLADVPASAVEPYFEDDDTGLEALRMNARVDRQLGSWGAVSVTGGLSNSKSEYFNIGALPNYGITLEHRYLRGDLFIENLHLRTFWNGTTGSTGPWLSYAGERNLDSDLDNDVVDVEVEAPVTFDTGPVSHRFNAGGGWRYKAIRFGYLAGGFDEAYVENHFQVFANEQATIGRVSAVGSLRIDAHPLLPIDQTISPRGALLFRLLDKTSLRATAGSAYRAPTAIESYMQFDLPTPVDGVYIEDFGNRDLTPERVTTVEVGLHDESTYYHQADVAVYLNRVTDLIYLDDVTLGLEPYDPVSGGIEIGNTGWVNLDPVYTGAGVEAEVELFPTDGLDLYANLSLSQVLETVGAETNPDKSSSTLKVNAGASYRTPYRTDVSFDLSYLSAQEWGLRTYDPQTLALLVTQAHLDPRLLASARVAVRPFPDEDFELGVTAWNLTELFGDGFQEHPEGQYVTGRLYGSVGWRF